MLPAPKIRRNKTACAVAALAALVLIFALGVLTNFASLTASAITLDQPRQGSMVYAYMTGNSFLFGLLDTCMGLSASPFLFPVTFPVTLAVWGTTIGRLPHQGVTDHGRYIRTGIIIGALMTGLACAFLILPLSALFNAFDDFGSTPDQPLSSPVLIATAGTLGTLIGAIAGALTAGIHLMILRPQSQLTTDVERSAEIFA